MSNSPFDNHTSRASKRAVSKLQNKIVTDVVIPTNPNKIHHLKNTTRTTARLPHLWRRNKRFSEAVEDVEIRDSLENSKQLNWCRTTHPKTPVKTIGDGQCLFYAVSIYIWAITNEAAVLLRKLVHQAFRDDQGLIRRRWERENSYFDKNITEVGLVLNSQDRDREWKLVVDISDYRKTDSTASGQADLPYHCIEEIHIFVLANVLRRPIIVLSEPVMRNIEGATMAPNNCGGIYLPLLWEPKDCFKSPVVIGFSDNHFVPILSTIDPPESQYMAVTAEHAVPLVTSELSPLMIHFVTAEEEAVAHHLLTRYLQVTELVRTVSDSVQNIPCAKLSFVDINEEFDVMKVIFSSMQSIDMPAKINQHTESNLLGLQSSHVHQPAHLYAASSSESPAPIASGFTESERFNQGGLQLNLSTDPEANERRPVVSEGQQSEAVHVPSPAVLTSLGSYQENRLSEKCTYPGCNQKAKTESHTLCSDHFKTPSQNKCRTEDCKFTGTPEQEGYCSKCFADFKNFENLTSMQILDEVPRQPRANMELTQTFYKCNSHVCNAIGFEPFQGYCRDCYVRGVRAGKIKRPMQKISNVPHVPEAAKSLCSTPGCCGMRAENEVGMCQKCFDENMRIAVEVSSAGGNHDPTAQAQRVVKKAKTLKTASPANQPSPSRKVGINPEVELINFPQESITYAVHGEEIKQCIMNGCENPGYEATNNLCQECFNVLCKYHASKANPAAAMYLDAAGAPKEMVRKCARLGCSMYGSVETNGYCSKCFFSVLYKDEEVLPPNVEPLYPVEPILPEYMYNNPELVQKIACEQRVKHLRETRAKPCCSPNCDRFGDPIFDGYCSQCYERHVPRNNVVFINSGRTVMQKKTYPVKYSNVCIRTRGANSDAVIVEQAGMPDANAAQTGVQIGNNNRMQINTHVHSTVMESTGRCRTPGCDNYGNAKCEGFCNTCFPFYNIAH